jgi:hypothetical protein
MMFKPIPVVTALLLVAGPAQACTFTYERGYSPREIRENPGMRTVTGTFRFIQNPETGFVATDSEGYFLGRIDGPRGRSWRTTQLPITEIAVECAAYIAPTGSGWTGTFWISRERQRGGRHFLMLFESAPAREAAPAPRR